MHNNLAGHNKIRDAKASFAVGHAVPVVIRGAELRPSESGDRNMEMFATERVRPLCNMSPGSF